MDGILKVEIPAFLQKHRAAILLKKVLTLFVIHFVQFSDQFLLLHTKISSSNFNSHFQNGGYRSSRWGGPQKLFLEARS